MIGIVALMMVLLVPAVVNMKGAGDMTNGTYAIASVLEQARAYAMGNNTYVWVGFFEEDANAASTDPATAGNGRVVLSTVASMDGTCVYDPNSSVNPDPIDRTMLRQVNKLVKLDNIHLQILTDGTGTGGNFDGRPTVDSDAFTGTRSSKIGNINATPVSESSPPTNTKFPFHYPLSVDPTSAQYTFRKTIQFSPRGEASINSTYDLRRVSEIGVVPTRGNTVLADNANISAIQFSGIAGNFRVYRR